MSAPDDVPLYGATRVGPPSVGKPRPSRFFVAHVLRDRVDPAPDPCAEDPEGCTFGAMALDRRGRVVASWTTRTGDRHVHVGRLDGGQWTELGAWASEPVETAVHVLAAGQGETLYLLSVAGSTSGPMKLARYDGTAWTDVPAPAPPVSVASPPALACDAEGRPVLAFTTIDPATEISSLHVERLRDGGWSALADGFVAQGAVRPRLALARTGAVAVAWLAYAGGKVDTARDVHAYLRVWEHGRWHELGGSATGEGLGSERAGSIDVAIDDLGRPLVVMDQGDRAETHHDVIARRWDDTTWTGIDRRHRKTVVSATGTFAVWPRIAVHERHAWIAWSLHNGSEGVLAHAPF